MNKVKRVAVTGAAGQIGYSLLPRIANGDIFGLDTPVALQLLEVPPVLPALEGVKMELEDCSFPLLQSISCSDKPEVAFKDADLILLVGSKPRSKGMERKDLILDNGPIFTGQGRAINDHASSDVRVVVVGNPCNTNCLITMHNAPDVPRHCFTAMTRLDQNRAEAQLAHKSDAHWGEIKNLIIWGNHSSTQFPDWNHATIKGKPANEVIKDQAWLQGEFIQNVQGRGMAIINARGKSSALSAACAALDHCRSLFQATPAGEFTSLCVLSDGSYGVDAGLISSFPCSTDGKGNWEIIQGLELNAFSQAKVQLSIDELISERETIAHLLS